MEERAKDSETLELYQERVRELELASQKPISQSSVTSPIVRQTTSEYIEDVQPSTPNPDLDADYDVDQGLGGELEDAVSGTTMTDLKLQIRKLKRELESVRKNEADASRLLVLENLLEDANRMKTRYEADYLAVHREKLVLQRDLEEIRSGKSMGDGAEAAIALRQRLNETVDQLDTLRKEHAELEVKFDTINKELIIAKSDLTLVNKDQLDILATLRESVNEDKVNLEADVERLSKQNKELQEKNRMQLEQVNSLLLEKGSSRFVVWQGYPEDIKSRLLALHEDNVSLKESLKTEKSKLQSARQALFEEAQRSYETQLKDLKAEVQRHKVSRYFILSFWFRTYKLPFCSND
ncbi:HOOK protein-domain-containing protein [Salix suchowensis]|nr:HOOK protein-domain-containing protein [Salix suchowensis]